MYMIFSGKWWVTLASSFWELLYQHVPIQLVSRPSFYQKVGCEMFVQ